MGGPQAGIQCRRVPSPAPSDKAGSSSLLWLLLMDFIVVLLQHHVKRALQAPGLCRVSPQQNQDSQEHIPTPPQTYAQDKYMLHIFKRENRIN